MIIMIMITISIIIIIIIIIIINPCTEWFDKQFDCPGATARQDCGVRTVLGRHGRHALPREREDQQEIWV